MNPQRLPVSCRRTVLAAAVCSLFMLPALSSQAAEPVPLGAEFTVNTVTTSNQNYSSTAIDADGDFVVVWQSDGFGTDGFEIRAQRYTSAGVAKGGETAVNAVAAGSQLYPEVAMAAAGNFVVAWTSATSGSSGTQIRARRFNASGVAQGGEIAVNTVQGASQFLQDIAIDADGDFVVAWERVVAGNYDVYARRFNAAGVAQGGEIAVNTVTAGDQHLPAVGLDADGDFVVVWQDGVSGGNYQIRAQRYNAASLPQGGEIAVSSPIGGNYAPAIAVDADGDFAVAWESRTSLGVYDIHVKRYNAAGLAQGAEIVANTALSGNQGDSAIAMEADGDFVVAWKQLGPNDDGHNIRARRYSAGGVAQGGEIPVGSVVSPPLYDPSIALDADGDFVVSWTAGRRGEFHDLDVQARRFQGPDSVDIALTQTDSADPAAVGSPLTYTLTASNLRSPATTTGIAAIDSAIGSATNLRVVDTRPAGSTSASGSGVNWSCPSAVGKLTCRYALTLRAGQIANPLMVTLTPPNSPGVLISNSGQVSANQLDSNQPNNRDVETTQLVPTVRFDIATASASESTPTTVRVQLSAASTQTVTVPYTRLNGRGAATFGTDYSLSLPSPITFNPGEVEKRITITPVDDTIHELNEGVSLTLSTPTNALLGSITNHQRTIVDNDP